MKDLIAKLTVGAKDADTKKALEAIGITASFLSTLKVIENPNTLDEALDNFDFRAEFDRRISKAVNTFESTLKDKYDFVDKDKKKEDKDDKPENKKEDKKDPVMEALDALKKELADLKTEKQAEQAETKNTRAKALLAGKQIPEVYVSKFDLEKDLEEQVDQIEADFYKENEAHFKAKPNFKLPNPNGKEHKVDTEVLADFKQQFKM